MKTINFFSIFCAVLVMCVMGCAEYPAYKITDQHFVNESSLNMYIGDEIQLTASPDSENFVWSSENEGVASVSQTGLVTAVGKGLSSIVVKYDDIEVSVPVTVNVPTVDKVVIAGGNGQFQIAIQTLSEHIATVRIYWNDNMDSIDFPVNHQAGIFSEIINYSGENGYIFYAVSFDKFGNRSVTSEIAAILLRNRDISTAGAMDDGTLTIQWGDNIQYVDYCKLSYINQVGVTVYQKVFPSEKTTVIRDYSSDLSFSTLCTLLPSMTDTFRMETVFPAVIESTPFKGPHILSSSAPYSLFTMDFDYGGEGIAFHDLSVNPPTDPNYRKNEGDELSSAVTIDVVGNCVGWFTSGEWLVYTIEVRDPGVYALDMRMAVGAIDGRFYVSMDGNRSETVTTPVIGGWGDYAWLFERFPHLKQPTFRLTAGKHKFRFTALGWPFNINIFKFTYTGE